MIERLLFEAVVMLVKSIIYGIPALAYAVLYTVFRVVTGGLGYVLSNFWGLAFFALVFVMFMTTVGVGYATRRLKEFKFWAAWPFEGFRPFALLTLGWFIMYTFFIPGDIFWPVVLSPIAVLFLSFVQKKTGPDVYPSEMCDVDDQEHYPVLSWPIAITLLLIGYKLVTSPPPGFELESTVVGGLMTISGAILLVPLHSLWHRILYYFNKGVPFAGPGTLLDSVYRRFVFLVVLLTNERIFEKAKRNRQNLFKPDEPQEEGGGAKAPARKGGGKSG